MKSIDLETRCMGYIDFSSESDERLNLISSLLLNTNAELEISEVKSLGSFLQEYLERKIILDSIFLNRSLEKWQIDEDELKRLSKEIKNMY